MAPRRAARASKGASEDVEAPASASKARTPKPLKEAAAKVTKPKGTGKRGRPKMDPALRKTQPYVPTGKPRGRPPKDPSQKKTATKVTPTGKGRGRPKAATTPKTATPAKSGKRSARKSAAAEDVEEEEEPEVHDEMSGEDDGMDAALTQAIDSDGEDLDAEEDDD